MAKNIAAILEETEKRFLPMLKKQFREDLKSVILYGSALTDGWRPGISDVNLLILFEQGRATGLGHLGKTADRLINKLRLNCKFLTLREFLNSSDVFPMEYLEIKDTHKVLYGEDPTEQLEISKDNLRHQIEERIRGGLNDFRQALVDSKGKKRAVDKVLKGWYGIQTAMIRSIGRLVTDEGSSSPAGTEGTDDVPADLLGLDTVVVTRHKAYIDSGDGDPLQLADEILDFWRELVFLVDRMESGAGG